MDSDRQKKNQTKVKRNETTVVGPFRDLLNNGYTIDVTMGLLSGTDKAHIPSCTSLRLNLSGYAFMTPWQANSGAGR